MRNHHLDRILGHLDDLDSLSLTILIQRLVKERTLLETVFNAVQEGILVIQKEGIIDYANRSACTLMGIHEKEIGRLSLWKAAPELSRAIAQAGSKHSEGALCIQEMELTYPEKRLIKVYLVPLDEQSSTLTKPYSVLIISDLTEQKQSTQAAIEKERFSSIFMLAAGVAHELGNPLNSINIHLNLIRRQLERLRQFSEQDKILRSLMVCEQEIGRLDGIIKNFLEAIRPQAPVLEPLNLKEVFEAVYALQEHELTNLNICVDAQALDKELPYIKGDKDQIQQVFFNLIKNAMDAMSCGGQLLIETAVDEFYLYVFFSDTGIGIATEQLPSIFEPYYTTKSTGYGLGMMIVQRIMHAHKGFIGIDSKPQAGTTITLQFPLQVSQRALQVSS